MTDKQIEDILKDYPVIKSMAKIQQENLLNLFPSTTATWSDMPSGHTTSNTTMQIAIKRLEKPLEVQQARVIEIACESLTVEQKELVELYYFGRFRKYDVMSKLHLSEKAFRNCRRELLNNIGRVLRSSYRHDKDVQTA